MNDLSLTEMVFRTRGGTDANGRPVGRVIDVHHPRYGVKGDGDALGNGTDDTAGMLLALSDAGKGGVVVLEIGRIYKVTQNIPVDNCSLMLNGSTLNLVLTGNYEGVQLKDHGHIVGGTVHVMGSFAFTVAAATDLVTVTGPVHTFANGGVIKLTSLTGGAGLALATNYFLVNVVNGAGVTTFQLSLTQGGAPVDVTTDGNGVGTTLEAAGGNFHAPIVVGDFLGGTGYVGWSIKHVEVHSDRDNSNCILVTGNSVNGKIDDIACPDSATVGRVVLLHWGGANGDPMTSGGVTYHPNNVEVTRIRGGVLTNATDPAGAALVFLSAAYNITVNDLKVKEINGSILSVFAGDVGFEYANAAEKAAFGGGETWRHIPGIKASNLTSLLSKRWGVNINGWADNAAGAPNYSIPCIIENIRSKGIGAGAAYSAVHTARVSDVTIINPKGSHHLHAVEFDEYSKNCKSFGGLAWLNQKHGAIQNHVNAPENCSIEGLRAWLNGQDGIGAAAGVFLGSCIFPKVEKCRFGDETAETSQDWGIRVDGCTLATIDGNYVKSVTAGGVAYSLASAGDTYWQIFEFRDNHSAAGFTYREGMTHVPVRRWKKADGTLQTELLTDGTAPPVDGTWQVGDRCIFGGVAAGGRPEAYCVTAGAPGVWKNYAAIDA